jgi:glycerol-3-phosphate dehydrogenase
MRKKDVVYLGLILLLSGVSAYGYAIASSVSVNVDSVAMEKRNIKDATTYVQVLADEDSKAIQEADIAETQYKIIQATRTLKASGSVDELNKAWDCIMPLLPTTTTETTLTTLAEVPIEESILP